MAEDEGREIGGAEEVNGREAGTRLVLPSDSPEEWAFVTEVLGGPMDALVDLDTMLTKFSSLNRDPQVAKFFATTPGSADAGKFDFDLFFAKGVPLMIEVALEMPQLFAGMCIPIFKMRSSWAEPQTLNKRSFSLTRRQCACLLAHSFFGSLKRPADVQANDFRFTAHEMFIGTATSVNSGTTFLNYFTVLGKNGIPDGSVTFHRHGYKRPSPWQWSGNEKPLCKVELQRGSIADCPADLHVEFANSFIGGGVMTGDAAMEEMLFVMQPELMIAMALENRMVDEEAVCVEGALKYSDTTGFGKEFEFAGDYNGRRPGPPPTICAIDAVRGGGIGFVVRDMNKARIAFDGARELATGHWGCGAFGNNHDLMFLKQWLAASEAGVQKIYYYDFDTKQSHHIFPLVRRLKHLTVGQLSDFVLNDLTGSNNQAAFSKIIADISTGHLEVSGQSKVSGADAPITEALAPAPAAVPMAVASPADDVDEGERAIYPLEVLQTSVPAGVNASTKEKHLSPEDFQVALGVDRSVFAAMPKWKQNNAKKAAGIY